MKPLELDYLGFTDPTTVDNATARIERLLSEVTDIAGAFPTQAKAVDSRFWATANIYAVTTKTEPSELRQNAHYICCWAGDTVHPTTDGSSVNTIRTAYIAPSDKSTPKGGRKVVFMANSEANGFRPYMVDLTAEQLAAASWIEQPNLCALFGLSHDWLFTSETPVGSHMVGEFTCYSCGAVRRTAEIKNPSAES